MKMQTNEIIIWNGKNKTCESEDFVKTECDGNERLNCKDILVSVLYVR